MLLVELKNNIWKAQKPHFFLETMSNREQFSTDYSFTKAERKKTGMETVNNKVASLSNTNKINFTFADMVQH